MPTMSVTLDGDDAWDLKDREIIHVTSPISVARLHGGMQSGKSSVAIRIDLPDGRVVIAETSLACWDAATAAFRGAEQRDADLARQRNRN
jgi:hypothetical protein